MFKKVIPIILLLCFMCSVSVAAVDTTQNAEGAPEMSQNFEKGPGGERGERPSGNFTPPQGDFNPPEGFTPPQNAGGFTPPENKNIPPQDVGTPEETPEMEASGEESKAPEGNAPFGGQMPEDMNRFFMDMENNQTADTEQKTGFLGFLQTYSTPITSVILLALAFVFVIFYRRKNY